jgi:hypothetical protein
MPEILPFNAPAHMRALMYSRKLPEVLWMPVVLYHIPGVAAAPLQTVASRLQDFLMRTHKVTDIDGHCIAPMVHVVEMPRYVISVLQQKQLDWMIDSVYCQVGYYDEPGVRGIVQSVACAMTIYDTCCCTNGVLLPDMHSPLQATLADAEEHERTVSNHFRSGISVWS